MDGLRNAPQQKRRGNNHHKRHNEDQIETVPLDLHYEALMNRTTARPSDSRASIRRAKSAHQNATSATVAMPDKALQR
jgi:hypothetical protein